MEWNEAKNYYDEVCGDPRCDLSVVISAANKLVEIGDQLQAENEHLREALVFYANRDNWAMHPEFANACCLDSADYGDKARKALKDASDD